MKNQTSPTSVLETQHKNTSPKILNIILVLIGLIIFGVGGFLIGLKLKEKTNVPETKIISQIVPTLSPTKEKANPKATYSIKKETGQTKDPSSYKYSLVSNTGKIVYSITNWNGFGYDVSDDNKYIAVMNYSEAMGDEILTLINSEGKILKEFGHLDSPQSLVPIYWTEHYYWIYMGIPIGNPVGVIRINADDLKVDKYLLSQ